jgi:hypothetical protein
MGSTFHTRFTASLNIWNLATTLGGLYQDHRIGPIYLRRGTCLLRREKAWGEAPDPGLIVRCGVKKGMGADVPQQYHRFTETLLLTIGSTDSKARFPSYTLMCLT